MKVKTTVFLLIVWLLLMPLLASAYSEARAQDGNAVSLAKERAGKATAILKQFSALGANSFPFEVLRRAKAVGVFNDVTQFTVLLSGGLKAKGVMSVRETNGWSVPVFVSLAGSSVRFKIAEANNFDFVFFIMDDKTLEKMKNRGIAPKLTLGSVVGGSGAELALEKASVIYYTFKDGKLSGDEVPGNNLANGVAFGFDNNLNKLIYQNRKAQTILLLKENVPDLTPPAPIEEFRQTLAAMLLQTK